jgi:Uncharacterized conserved protein (DUF2249)
MTAPLPVTDLIRLDLRELLASGGEPFDLIIGAAGRMPLGGALELTAPSEPVPLYSVMRRRGFARTTIAEGPVEWVVIFWDTGISPTATLGEIADRHRPAREILMRHGLDPRRVGSTTLSFAARVRGIDLDRLLEELHGAVRTPSLGLSCSPAAR